MERISRGGNDKQGLRVGFCLGWREGEERQECRAPVVGAMS